MRLPASPRISAVVVTRNEGLRLRTTVEGLADTLPAHSEIIVVDDGSEDGSTTFLRHRCKGRRLLHTAGIGSARARNHGARRATGDVIVSLDAHMEFDRDWWRPLIDALRRPRAGAAAPAVASMRKRAVFGHGFTLPEPDLAPAWVKSRNTSPFHGLVLPGCCRAMTRYAFATTGGYDEGLKARGGVDAEMALRFWLLGFENWIVPESKVWHFFRSTPPFPATRTEVLHNRLRTAFVHFTPSRLARVIATVAAEPEAGEAMLLAAEGNLSKRRNDILARRVLSDDWLFDKFGIAW